MCGVKYAVTDRDSATQTLHNKGTPYGEILVIYFFPNDVHTTISADKEKVQLFCRSTQSDTCVQCVILLLLSTRQHAFYVKFYNEIS